MKRYTHLTRDQRYQIANGLRQGYSQQIIADIVGVNKSTISREIRRNGASRGVFGGARCGRAIIVRSERTSRPWRAGRARPGCVLAGLIGGSSNGCCRRSGVRSRLACGLGKTAGCRSAMSGSTDTFARTSTTAAASISTYAAGKGGRNGTAARRGGAQYPID